MRGSLDSAAVFGWRLVEYWLRSVILEGLRGESKCARVTGCSMAARPDQVNASLWDARLWRLAQLGGRRGKSTRRERRATQKKGAAQCQLFVPVCKNAHKAPLHAAVAFAPAYWHGVLSLPRASSTATFRGLGPRRMSVRIDWFFRHPQTQKTKFAHNYRARC